MRPHIEYYEQRARGGLLFISFLMAAALVPFSMRILGIKQLDLGGVITVFLFGLTIVDLATRTKNIGLFLLPRGNLHMIFLVAFMFVVLVSFARNPLLPTSLSGGSAGGFKLYWAFFCSFLTYFMVIYWANRNKLTPAQLLLSLMYVVAAITFLGIFKLVTGISIPGLDTLAWSVNKVVGTGGAAGSLRIPFLEVYGQIGFFLALTSIGCSGRGRLVMLAYFGFCIFIGGGRATLLTTIMGFIVWLYLNRKFLLASLLVLAACLALFSVQLLHEIAPTPQLKRLTNIGSLQETSEGRHIVNDYLMDEILEHPIVGTAYGKEYDLPLIRSGRRYLDTARIEHNLTLGSHNTHLQILKNLGIVGYLPFIIIWLYPVYKLFPAAVARTEGYSWALSRDAQICIVLISALLIRMLVTGNGSEGRLYIFAAIISCAISQVVRHEARTSKLLKRQYKSSLEAR